MPRIPEPYSDEAREQGCTCYVPTATAHDIEPPSVRVVRDCPLHGWARDPDDERDRRRDDELDRRWGGK
jgi:hypothetical protein